MKTSPQLETSPVKELVRAGHEFAAAMGADIPLIEIAKLVSRLATALDVQLSRANTLVSLSAEPVAWTDEQELRDVEKFGCAYLFTVNPITPNADPRRVIKLYTAPPAPVSVPAALPNDIDGDDHPHLWSYNNGWNACRAAMLVSIYQKENGK